MVSDAVLTGAAGVLFVVGGTYELLDPSRFDWWLKNDAYDSDAKQSRERRKGYLRGTAFVAGGLFLLFLALT